ncbi:MAG: UDP-N-acetylglucosamine 2-epimerase (non-hydrolyzing) [Hahellaceae bacterium]|nr:UDP-N-acetylglucosamine 2-epimerase (non-hydrolyzing) [Hahellaceae bacterium]
MEKLKILLVVGARPNFMKIAPIMEAFEKFADVAEPVLLHTGQHYDHAMKALLFDQLGLPVPSIDLEVRGGTHAEQTANIMLRFEPVLDKLKPAAVLVVGDVNSTIACALVAVKKQIPVVHVEAGLRSRDLAMPEEVNRLLTDQISSRLYTTERLGNENLQSEGISADRIVFAGNVMIDTLLKNKKIAPELKEVLATNGLGKAEEVIEASQGRYIFMTLHRPSNVDSPETLRSLLECLSSISRTVPIVFAIHPRTKGNIERFGFQSLLDESAIYTAPPVGYLDSITLMSNAFVVMTDSGGIQEETTALGVPCITMRENTERWITVTEGTNTIVGVDPVKITNAFNDLLAGQGKAGRQPEFWDGHASERIVEDLICWLKKGA